MVKTINKFGDIKKNIEQLTPATRYVISQQVLADCNYFARKASGDMIVTSLHSDTQKGELRWDTPYALKVYYHGVPNTTENPNASLMWCEKAKSAFMDDWVEIVRVKMAEALDV